MTTGNAMGGGAKAAIAVLGLVGIAVLGNFIFMPDQATAPVPAANLTSAPAPETAAAASDEPASSAPSASPSTPEVSEATEATSSVHSVTIENWRVEPDGAGLISGRSAPLSLLSVLIDGAKISEGAATAAGDFVLLFTLPPNDKPSLMTVEASLPDGTRLPGPAAIALAPIAGSDVVAAAVEPAAVAEPEGAAVAEPKTAPTAVMITDEGAKVVSAVPEVVVGGVTPVTIAAIAYTPEGHVQLSGLGTAGQTVRLYLNNAAAAETAVLEDSSWQVVLTDTAPGIYTLRADQIDASGKVTARFETPFKRETTEALASLTGSKVGPAAGAGPVTEPQTVASEPSPSTALAETEPETPATEPVSVATADATSEPPSAEASTETTTPALPDATDAAEVMAPDAETTAPGPTASNAQQPAPTAPQPIDESPSQATATQPSQPGAETSVNQVLQTVSITVQPGYSLWKIARDTYGDGILYVQVYEANKNQIGDPDLIYPGQVFELPRK
ncbi:LysM peptidoglycan-binding domain-containing protein [Thioclava sp. FR2]|uniref:LysM peptidoglycan-binding domain-containing protein n=1 Tax=Thioclava sp. FR2 TaxID=3445780 RepID=UPI003EBD43F3